MATDLTRYAMENHEAIMEAYEESMESIRELHRTIVVAASDPALPDVLYGHQGYVVIVDEHGVELGGHSELFPCARISYGRSYVEDYSRTEQRVMEHMVLPDVEAAVKAMEKAEVEALWPKEAKPRKGWETPYGPQRRR